MKALNLRVLVMSAASLAVVGVASPAVAKGCNGVVNPTVWGCAPWDNNNGPQYPNYRKKTAPSPVAAGSAPSNPSNGSGPNGGGGFISNNGGTLIQDGAAYAKPPK